jgi:RNA polymerase subunit RPABC4/transcription elongation factor Spt4
MMWGVSNVVRRVSAAQWETKLDADFRTKRIEELRALLGRPRVAGPPYEPCPACGTTADGAGWDGLHDLHRPYCAKYGVADEAAARARQEDEDARTSFEEQLESLRPEPTWVPFPKRYSGFDRSTGPIGEDRNPSIEAGYQRYLVADGGRDAQRLCQACKAALPSDAKFCDACGVRCPRCAKCGASNREGAPFCKQCGASLGVHEPPR